MSHLCVVQAQKLGFDQKVAQIQLKIRQEDEEAQRRFDQSQQRAAEVRQPRLSDVIIIIARNALLHVVHQNFSLFKMCLYDTCCRSYVLVHGSNVFVRTHAQPRMFIFCTAGRWRLSDRALR